MITSKLVEGKMGQLFVYTKEHFIKGKGLDSPLEKIAQEKSDAIVTAKAEIRATECWVEGCPKAPRVWVREVQFDLFTSGMPINTASISSANYDGPIPGLCLGHEHHGAVNLAEAVYFSRNEIYWGFRPTRFVVIFTDGTKMEGDCVQIDSNPIAPIVKETFNGR